MDKKKGGKRKGAGRKAKDPTVVLSFRVPENKAEFLKPLIKGYIKELLNANSFAPQPNQKPIAKSKKSTHNSLSKEPTLGELWKALNSKK